LRAVKYTSILVAAVACISFAARPLAHEIPSDVRVQIFVVPKGDHLQIVVRAPIAAMNEIEWPTTGVFLDLSRADAALRQGAADWIGSRIDLYEGDRRLERPSLVAVTAASNADLSFDSYERARAHTTGPPPAADAQIALNQALLDAVLEYRIQSDRSRFSIAARFDKAGVRSLTILRFLAPTGVERAFTIHDEPGIVPLDPRWFQAAWRFVGGGFFHILDGVDHLLFLLCLVIPFRRVAPLVPVVTAFTVAHSITLIASAFGFVPDALWFPPLIETLIAITIVYMAIENIVYAAMGGPDEAAMARRWIIAFAFGLIHGFGFSFALRETLQFAGDHLLTSLLAFNVGVEIGQVAVLVVLIPALGLLFRYLPERLGIIILSALVAHTAWHWMIERGGELAKFPLPRLDAAFMASAMRGLMAVLILVAGVWLVSGLLRRWLGADIGMPAADAERRGR
jgi:HupE / UreJ protein